MGASVCISHRFVVLVFIFTCLLYVLSSFSLAKEAIGPFNSIYSFGNGDSSSSSAADHIAATLSLPAPQPYTQRGTEFFESGLSFATPGATIMKPFFFLKNGISPPPQSHDLSQISTFMKFFYEDCFSFHDCGRNNKVLPKALIFMDQPGINDYKHAFLHGKSISEASHLVPEVVETIKNSIERLINEAGAKTLMVSGILPVGCFPGFRTLFPEGDSIGKNRCHKGLNMFSKLHNDHLWQAILELRLKYRDVHIVYADYYKAFMAVLKNHVFLGFKTKNLMKACCGSGNGPFNFDMQKKCGEEGVAVCSNRASYLHWDGFLLTPEALENLIDTLFSKKGFVFPELKVGEETAEVDTRHHSRIHARVGDISSVIRHLLFV